jgi:maltose O-acetyltransferase
MNVIILAHDASMKRKLGYTKLGKVNIGNNVFIGAGTIVLPNVTIGDNSIIGAGSLVSKSIPQNMVAAGNPAKILSTVEEFWSKHKSFMKQRPLYEENFTVSNNVSPEMREQMELQMTSGEGYIR